MPDSKSTPPAPSEVPGINPIIIEMHTQNDRGAAITGGVYLEEKLKEAIELRWPPISNTERDHLFKGYAPLATFSAKIHIAKAMGVLNVHSKSDCDKIRLIRNKAAHLGTPFSFDAPEIAKLVDAIHCVRHFPIDEASSSERRNQFTVTVKYMAMYLFLQEDWKKRFGFNAVLPDMRKTPDKSRRMKSSSDSKSGS